MQNSKSILKKNIWISAYYEKACKAYGDSPHPGMEIIRDYIKKSKSILDLGCGEGTRLNQLYIKGKKYTGIDISNYAISLAKKKYPLLSFINGDLEKLPFKDQSFDLVYSAFVLEHLDNPEKVLKESFRVITRGGDLILLAPNFGAPNRASPVFKSSRLKKFLKGLLKDFYSTGKTINWNKVDPVTTIEKYKMDMDTTVEPYLGSLKRYLIRMGFKIIISDSCWDQELANAKFVQMIFKLLAKVKIYPFINWGPHLLVVAKK